MESGKIVAVVQARMKSSRLPGKVLRSIDGMPMLGWVIKRLSGSKWIEQTVVATTMDPSDDAVVEYCQQQGNDCTRGDMHDVLDRFYRAAIHANADIIVRVTADCPFIDPALVDETVEAFFGLNGADGPFDFAANRLPPPFHRTYPIGLDAEVCTFNALERAWHEADLPFHREHVMPYFYEGIEIPERVEKLHSQGYLELFKSPRNFRVLLLQNDRNFGDLRWTVDTPADLELLEKIVQRLKKKQSFHHHRFRWQEVLEIVLNEPHLLEVNAGTYHKDFHESEQTT
jgi:spore coat polysaccharide biosynthesis protein SpsF